jgi:Fe-S-cluster containining protein
MVVMGKKTECSCRLCIAACQHHPGALMPSDLGRLAKFLGLTEEKLFKKHIAVLNLGGRLKVRLPFPAARHLPAGKVKVYDPEDWRPFGCHWLTEDDRCAVHPVKPMECAEAMPHKFRTGPHPRRVAAYRAWSRPENRRKLARLLGEE